MTTREKILELENKKKELGTKLLESKQTKESMDYIVDNLRLINFALDHLKEIDVIDDDDSIIDVDNIIASLKRNQYTKNETMGEIMRSIQRLLFTRIEEIKNKTLATKLITNGKIAAVLQDAQGYSITPVGPRINNPKSKDPYPLGQLGGMSLLVDSYMRWDDNRVIFFKDKDEVFTLKIKDSQNVLI